MKSTTTTTTISSTNILSIRRSNLPLMNAGNGLYPTSSSSPSEPSSPGEVQRQRRRVRSSLSKFNVYLFFDQDRALHDLGFANPGPKNLVNVANVPPRRLKTRQLTTQEKPRYN
jgi:hypothetical protein